MVTNPKCDVHTDKEGPIAPGCVYHVGSSSEGIHQELHKVFCHKLTIPGTDYCPKHHLYVEDDAKEADRRREESRRKREYRKAEREALALSPLRAENWEYEQGVSGFDNGGTR